jgi:glucose/arabinose dehydrogenase
MLWNSAQSATTSSLESLSSQRTDFLSLPYPQTIAFIDPTVSDAAALALDLQADAKFMLDPTRDGISQITEILGRYQGVTGVNIIAHGGAAELQLGNASLSSRSLQKYSQELQQWKSSLSPQADILFYACNVAEGEAGQAFVKDLSNLTGADIVASTDLTGDAAQGGDWDLEYSTGEIETTTPFTASLMSSYRGLLPTLFTNQIPVLNNFTDGTGVAGDYELGMEFTSSKAGTIDAIRYYKAAGETAGAHVGKIWSSAGGLLGSVTFANETTSGWQQQALGSALTIAANTKYVVSVNVKTHYVATGNGLASTITNGDLSAVADNSNGVFNLTPDLFPTQSFNNTNYFRDVVFTPTATNTNRLGSIALTGTPAQNQTLTTNLTDLDGFTAANVSYQWQQNNNGTWASIAGATSQTLNLTQALVGKQVRSTANYVDTLGNTEAVISSATIAVANINDAPTGTVTITGAPTQGVTLTATNNLADVDGLGPISYQWLANNINITGATANTLVLGQAQVGTTITVKANYTDGQGTAESVASSATLAVANINDAPTGTVTINGAQTPGSTLTATNNLADADGLGAITYQWQRLVGGGAWTNVSGANSPTLILDSSFTGQQVRVNATYTDAFGMNENVFSLPSSIISVVPQSQSIFTPQAAPLAVNANFTDGTGAAGDYALGMEFTSSAAGKINAIRYYKAASETGQHTGKIWSSDGTLLGSVIFANESPVGWQQQALSNALTITAGATYVVSVNANTHYVAAPAGIATTIGNGNLSAVADGSNGVFNFDPNLFPNLSFNNTHYFRDIVFTPTPATINNLGSIALTGTPTQNQTLTATVNDADGFTAATVNYQWQQNNNGTWANIAGATSQTLSLTQALVGKQVRSTANYSDTLGNTEAVTSTATTAIANVNDLGAVVISGTPKQNQVITANVTDADGLAGVTIGYQWQQSNDGNTWTILAGATNQNLTLDNSLVGKQVRVIASYQDALGTAEIITSTATTQISAPPISTSFFPTTTTPSQTNSTDGPGIDWEYGMKFTSSDPGQIQAIRYYKAPSETGTHVGNIWSATGELLSSVTFTNETASGWQQQELTNQVAINANTTYVVSVNTNDYYATTLNGFDASLTSGSLTAPIGAGVYNETKNTFPNLVYSNENYFRDVVFYPGVATALKDSATIFVSESAGFATVTAVRTGSTQERVTVEYTVNEVVGTEVATAGLDFTQPTFQGRANTGQIVFEIGETETTFRIPILNDNLREGNETFAVGLQNPVSNRLGTPRTVLVTILDDDSPATISVSEANISISEGLPTAAVTLQRSGNVTAAVSVNFNTSNGTAQAGTDYTATSNTVNFGIGETIKTIYIPILNDTVPEVNETFVVTLNSPTGGAILGSQQTSTITIIDNDLNLGTLNRQNVVDGLNAPTALDWTPDGRYILVAEKSGGVRVVDNGVLRPTPLIDLSSQVNDVQDRGLLGIAIHPNFGVTPYVYLLYTYDPPETIGQNGDAGPDGGGNRPARLLRVTVNPLTMVADLNSLLVILGTNSIWNYTSRPDADSTGLIDINPSGIINGSNNAFNNGLGTTTIVPTNQINVGTQDNNPNANAPGVQNQNIRDYLAGDSRSHTIGAVVFGPDGYLYVTNGDGTSYNFADPRAVRVQDINNLSGKVLRIDPLTGAGVAGNPFYESNDPNSNRSKVFYSGVRNAFRFTFDPITTLPVIGDVGWSTWEEINTGAPGSNFGWPYLEGPNQTASYQNLPQAISFYNNGNKNNPGDQTAVFPLLSRRHGAPDFANAIMVGDFYNSNTLMFGDVNGGTLYAATLDATTRQITNVQVFDSNVPLIVDMEMGPDGFLYGVNIATGSIVRWDPA